MKSNYRTLEATTKTPYGLRTEADVVVGTNGSHNIGQMETKVGYDSRRTMTLGLERPVRGHNVGHKKGQVVFDLISPVTGENEQVVADNLGSVVKTHVLGEHNRWTRIVWNKETVILSDYLGRQAKVRGKRVDESVVEPDTNRIIDSDQDGFRYATATDGITIEQILATSDPRISKLEAAQIGFTDEEIGLVRIISEVDQQTGQVTQAVVLNDVVQSVTGVSTPGELKIGFQDARYQDPIPNTVKEINRLIPVWNNGLEVTERQGENGLPEMSAKKLFTEIVNPPDIPDRILTSDLLVY